MTLLKDLPQFKERIENAFALKAAITDEIMAAEITEDSDSCYVDCPDARVVMEEIMVLVIEFVNENHNPK
jgi:hypothetical protein